MRYAQIKAGNKLHLVFEAENKLSQPLCGIKANNYRMTINVPLAHSCQSCQRIYKLNRGVKTKKIFYNFLVNQEG